MNSYSSALNDFKRARSRAALRKWLARLGASHSDDLLRFDEVRKMLGAVSQLPRGLHQIPLDAIVGSVGRYEDFNRQFLPRQASQGGRWARVRMAVEGQGGLPPIEVYKIGAIYFVLDGHHRVSVAREVGATTIEAYVTEIPTKVQLSPTDNIADLILKTELQAFTADTQLAQTRPDVDFRVTLPGRIQELREHIAVHRYYMGQAQQREISLPEAAAHWADEVYVPAVHSIRQLGLLRDFPQRTEADMYLWLMRHRSELEKDLGWNLGVSEAAAHAWNRLEGSPRRLGARLRRWLSTWLPLAAPPVPTAWQLPSEELAGGQTLFPRLLVPLSGEDASWTALDVALQVAQREHSELRGIHVQPLGKADPAAVQPLREEFERRVAAAGLRGSLVLEQGDIHRRVEARSHWSDLVVLHLKYPPGTRPLERLLSGLRTFLQRSPRPVLVVPQKTALQHALLAYDGSRKARQALYLAAYLVRRWGIRLTVLTAHERSLRPTLAQTGAKNYLLARGVQAEYVQRRGRAAQAILSLAREHGCDFVLMGGYAQSGILEVVRGSNLDVVLREFHGAVWVCN
jgi:nucleotide-binding universal stress UspA family protein